MSPSVHIDNKNKYILIFSERPAQRLDNTTLTVEAKYPTNFTQPKKDLCQVYTIKTSYKTLINTYKNINVKNIICVKKIIFGILLHVAAKMVNI